MTQHLVEPGDHGRLKFHPCCPVCRQERLFGSLSSEPVISRRAQALLAGGVLAVSGAAPGVAVASEPDWRVEGTAAPDPSGGELDDPGFDPGGDTALPFDTGRAPAAPVDAEDTGDGAPLDAEPELDLDARLADEEVPVMDERSAAAPAEAVARVDAVRSSDPAAADPSLEAVPPVRTTEDEPAGADQPASLDDERTRTAPRSDRGPSQQKEKPEAEQFAAPAPSRADVTGNPSPMPPEPYVAPVTPAPDTEPVAVAPAGASVPAPPESSLADASSYVVEPGDSLWSIAKRLLGRDASPARIAREVNRLWSLNEARIATGDPDLLMVGTRLRLR